ncbi:MotA/TolQ/ExbB proton channel family protein [Entomomonas sp. E2T0]|uniref:MotA/TolQ/ExbB proton channel family protein n=1 Tax=Entomomonas sp. E2T0 TaxID=2930213 RepID=UPI0022283B91|nr:MotA/TolQ/ExbB proton channel family protein [Entomomonas sp. E2T0]UYZ85263.1 MotA/TolQ/ExbB proton channel family protein [Entomomonas sp. E2T0]
MWELVKAGGIMMFPLILCSIVAMGIIIERLIVLRATKVAPAPLMGKVWTWFKSGQIDHLRLEELRNDSPLGQILAAGLSTAHKGREQMKEAIEEAGGFVIHNLERYLNTLGTIAAITPLLGLLGTIFGLIEIFSAFLGGGAPDSSKLAGGIAMALVTTATGLIVAIPSVFFHRFLLRKVDELVVTMEQNVTRLVDAIDDSYNQRETTYAPDVKPTKKRKTGKPVSKASEARGEST